MGLRMGVQTRCGVSMWGLLGHQGRAAPSKCSGTMGPDGGRGLQTWLVSRCPKHVLAQGWCRPDSRSLPQRPLGQHRHGEMYQLLGVSLPSHVLKEYGSHANSDPGHWVRFSPFPRWDPGHWITGSPMTPRWDPKYWITFKAPKPSWEGSG